MLRFSGAAIMLMIQNNLDPRVCISVSLLLNTKVFVQVAQFPHELVTYGGNGSVFQNWYSCLSLHSSSTLTEITFHTLLLLLL